MFSKLIEEHPSRKIWSLIWLKRNYSSQRKQWSSFDMGTLLGNVAEEANAGQCAQQTGILMGVLGSCKLWKHKVHFLGSSLVAEWLGFWAFTAVAWGQSLVGELRSYKLCGWVNEWKNIFLTHEKFHVLSWGVLWYSSRVMGPWVPSQSWAVNLSQKKRKNK